MQKTLKQLCADLLDAKKTEQEAAVRRIDIETEIIQLTGLPEEGAKTVDCEGFKIKVDQRINRKIDAKLWSLVVDQIPESLRPISIVEEIKVEAKGVRWLRDNEPGYYKLLCTAMEEKPAKPAVKVEAI